MNDDPRIELPEVGIGIRTRALRRCGRFGARPCGERAGDGYGADGHDEQA
jgi:hypothetical protein